LAKLSRNKGARFEREAAAAFRRAFPDARRGLAQTRSGGESADVIGVPGYWIECKVGARPNPLAALRQAENNSNGDIPVAVCKVDRETPTVTLPLADFIALLSKTTHTGREPCAQLPTRD
jgi:hypothetical protein